MLYLYDLYDARDLALILAKTRLCVCFRCTGSIDTLVVAVRVVATCTTCNVRWNGIPLIGRQTGEQLRYKTAGLVKVGTFL